MSSLVGFCCCCLWCSLMPPPELRSFKSGCLRLRLEKDSERQTSTPLSICIDLSVFSWSPLLGGLRSCFSVVVISPETRRFPLDKKPLSVSVLDSYFSSSANLQFSPDPSGSKQLLFCRFSDIFARRVQDGFTHTHYPARGIQEIPLFDAIGRQKPPTSRTRPYFETVS